MQRARQRGDGSGERYLRTYAQLPGQPSFGVDPAMEALKRIQRLSWKQAVCKLQRIGQHCRAPRVMTQTEAGVANSHKVRARPAQASKAMIARFNKTVRLNRKRRLSAPFPIAIDRSG